MALNSAAAVDAFTVSIGCVAAGLPSMAGNNGKTLTVVAGAATWVEGGSQFDFYNYT